MDIDTWRKSSRSEGNNSDCVEIGHSTTVVAIRDTKNRDAGIVAVDRGAWLSFLGAVDRGAFDSPGQ
ncbi:DUF397 domain-containing protein [Solihabitans fulvus]|uniref:DUF397 domain-containing protein n=1 Tax=Solihabitans fulvus TaxID=1892852 RepID=A0A5B2WM12_9PSEU|nr:DUF397 domain-containing protein [Solihabitans fulvus]